MGCVDAALKGGRTHMLLALLRAGARMPTWDPDCRVVYPSATDAVALAYPRNVLWTRHSHRSHSRLLQCAVATAWLCMRRESALPNEMLEYIFSFVGAHNYLGFE
jgi:hypothetical protein